MVTSDIKQLGSGAKKLTAKTRATGPKSEAGKLRSALNATKHGLSGRCLLLPGEDAQSYTDKMDGIFEALSPKNRAEAELVALVGDDLHKLERLGRIERGIVAGRIEQLLGLTGSGEKANTLTNAIQAVGQAVVAWSVEPVPTTRNPDFDRRYRAMSQAVALVGTTITSIPMHLIDACDAALDAVRGKKDDLVVSSTAYMQLFQVARELLTVLLDQGKHQEVEQDELRATIATIALPDEAELKKLARYRSMLELSLHRRLAALEQVRKLAAETVAGEKDVERAREYRVRLRVVA